MKYAFIKTLYSLAKRNPKIMLLIADLGFTVCEEFRDAFPDRFINVGVAEQDLIGIAAGLALTGKIVVVYSIPTFTILRPFEQIRNDVAYHHLPVILVGTGAGLSYSEEQITHQAIEDITLMRTLPYMTVLCPADPVEAVWATKIAVSLGKPVYLRLGKRGEPIIYTHKPNLHLGKASVLQNGKDCAILATGNIVYHSLLAAKLLAKQGIRSTVASIHTIKPIDRKYILMLARQVPLIITVEEHLLTGGLGSAVAEVLAASHVKARLLPLGINDRYLHEIGSPEFLRGIVGLTPQAIAKRIRQALY